MDRTVIYGTFHATAKEYTFLSVVHETLSKIDHMGTHMTNLSKFKRTEIISSIFSNHNGTKLEINKSKTRKFTNM